MPKEDNTSRLLKGQQSTDNPNGIVDVDFGDLDQFDLDSITGLPPGLGKADSLKTDVSRYLDGILFIDYLSP